MPLKESCKVGMRTEDSPEAMGIQVWQEVGEKDTEEGREPGSVCHGNQKHRVPRKKMKCTQCHPV